MARSNWKPVHHVPAPFLSMTPNLKSSVSDDKRDVSIISITPQRLQEVYAHVNGCDDGSVEVNVESCNWLNVIVDFLFRELRDSPEVKRLVQYCE